MVMPLSLNGIGAVRQIRRLALAPLPAIQLHNFGPVTASLNDALQRYALEFHLGKDSPAVSRSCTSFFFFFFFLGGLHRHLSCSTVIERELEHLRRDSLGLE